MAAKPDPLVRIGCQLPQSVASKLASLAQRNERSAAAEIRIALYKHLGLLDDRKAA